MDDAEHRFDNEMGKTISDQRGYLQAVAPKRDSFFHLNSGTPRRALFLDNRIFCRTCSWAESIFFRVHSDLRDPESAMKWVSTTVKKNRTRGVEVRVMGCVQFQCESLTFQPSQAQSLKTIWMIGKQFIQSGRALTDRAVLRGGCRSKTSNSRIRENEEPPTRDQCREDARHPG